MGWGRIVLKRDALCFRIAGAGSEDGVRAPLRLFTDSGVTGASDCRVVPLIFLASFLKGDIERERVVLAELGARDVRVPLGGVTR